MAAHVFNDPDNRERLKEFWASDEPLRVLAKEFGCTEACLSARARKEGLPSRKGRAQEIIRVTFSKRFQLKIVTRQYLEDEARKRKLTPRALEIKIMDTVLNDRLINAILDDDVGSRVAA